MSPEQAWAEPLDHRSDIFSAGVVLWELLVGERLHKESHIQSLLDAVRRAEVPAPSSFRDEVPEELDAIVARATAANPAERYADAGAMADALVTYLAGRGPVHASRRIGEMLADMPPPSSSEVPSPGADIPLHPGSRRDTIDPGAAYAERTAPPLRPRGGTTDRGGMAKPQDSRTPIRMAVGARRGFAARGVGGLASARRVSRCELRARVFAQHDIVDQAASSRGVRPPRSTNGTETLAGVTSVSGSTTAT